MSIDTTSDYHMHTRYSDGSGKINEMARAAVAAGLRQITVTDHMPLPFATYYAMEHEQIHSYRREIAAAQKQFDGQLKIGRGLEAEYISEFRPWIKEISEMGWDQLLCSIHHLPGGGKLHLVNGSLEEFTRLIEHHDNDGEKLCRNYYQTLQEGFSTGLFQIAGHLDIIKKFNAKNI
ncbi:MAG: histidinol-phosphatase HisJ family protein, partial [Thermodesulfobacteriota bacterium]|nr:histidinol-phosphatase HisJ family protein [Thermodesulfobacteriota bacterium]